MEPQDEYYSKGSSQFQRLPQEALACVLGAVPQRQRLSSCALVCRTWRGAALVATTALEMARSDVRREQALTDLSAWLAKHGGGLRSLSVNGFIREDGTSHRLGQHYFEPYSRWMLQLPFLSLSQLQALSLRCVSFGSSSSSSTATTGTASVTDRSTGQQLGQLTALTSLDAQECTICDSSPFRELSALTRLQHLEATPNFFNHKVAAQEFGLALAAALPQLTALTRVHVRVTPDDAAVISSLSGLQQLQALRLDGVVGPLSISWTDLPATVTVLELMSGVDVWQLQPAGCSFLTQTSQQQLCVDPRTHGGVAAGSSLLGIPQLRQLQISAWWSKDVADVENLLAALAQQQQLQSLTLDGNLALPREKAHHFAALAASSQLTALSMIAPEATSPAAIVSAMFGAGRRLPLLQHFRLWRSNGSDVSDDDDDTEASGALAPQDLLLLLQGCPGLRDLEFLPAAARASGVGWSQVAGAAAAQLTKVVVGSGSVNSSFISQFLAQLPGLQDLTVSCSSNVPWAALVPLTLLTLLTRLEMEVVDNDLAVNSDGIYLIVSKAGPGQPPDVAQQLRALCCDNFQALRILHEEELQQQKQQLQQQKQQLALTQARIADLEAQLAAAQASLADAAATGFVGRHQDEARG